MEKYADKQKTIDAFDKVSDDIIDLQIDVVGVKYDVDMIKQMLLKILDTKTLNKKSGINRLALNETEMTIKEALEQ